MNKLIIRVWNNNFSYFIDLINASNNDSYEVKRFSKKDYGDILTREMTYHVNRIMSITNAEYRNDSDLDF